MELVSLSQAPGRQFGKYNLIEPLATGGMAETYRARFTLAAGVTKEVVIKKILPAFADDKSFVQMFVNEAKIAASFSHGNIAQVFDFGEIDGEYFLAMELVDGRSLQQVLKRAKQLDVKEIPVPLALLITMRICEGLHYAHTRVGEDGKLLRIVHRDVTPENVIISYEGQVKLVDFGIAKARTAGRPVTEPGMVKGKYLYFSPEQAAGKEVDHRTDVYSAGIVLYAMLCGKLPFEGQAVQVMHRIVTETLPAPRGVNPALSPVLEGILLKALAKDRNERYPTAQAFGEALSSYLYREEPSFSPTRLASFMTYLFEESLKAEGRNVSVPEEFLKQLTVWKERSRETPPPVPRRSGDHVPPPQARRSGDRQRLPQELSDQLSLSESTQRPDSGLEITQRTGNSTSPLETSGPLLEPTLTTTDGPTGPSSNPAVSTGDAIVTRIETMTLPRMPPAALAARRRAWLIGAALVGLALVVGGVAVGPRLLRPRSAGGVEVRVTSTPSGAWVVLDGQRLQDKTPVAIRGVTASERHQLTVLAPGAWKPFTREFTPELPGPFTVHALLEKASEGPIEPLDKPNAPPLEVIKTNPGAGTQGTPDEAQYPVETFQVTAERHRFVVNRSQAASLLDLNPNERYKVWTDGELTLNRELGESTRQVLYVTKGAEGTPDTVGLAGPRPVELTRIRALYAFVVDPSWKDNQGAVTVHVQPLGGGTPAKLLVSSVKNAVELLPQKKFTLNGLLPGQGYQLTARAGANAPGPVACALMLHEHEADAVTGGQFVLEAGQTREVSGGDSLECVFLDLSGEAPTGTVEVDIRPGARTFAPPL